VNAAQQVADEVAAFAASFSFGLDPFQLKACTALAEGRSVLVAAPTGAGKTVVGEFAADIALRTGAKCFYTTPIKALSNQKFTELVARYGADRVGLLTGDSARNSDAPLVVMTTEVLRNMLYAGSPALRGLSHVVMDEVHYLADRFRGAVWEEVILALPEPVRLVSLSATVSNAEEFGEWLETVRGDTTVVVEEHRPVPLWQSVLVGRRMYNLFADPGESGTGPVGEVEVNRELMRIRSEQAQADHSRGGGRNSHASVPRNARSSTPRGARSNTSGGARSADGPRPRRIWVPSRADVIEILDREGLLPAITFIFSRAGCAAAVAQCLSAGLRLATPDERTRIRTHARERTSDLSEADLRVLGFWEWLDGLERGIAAHHAGMLPRFKEITEELFADGLVKAVFATETLALGINMPARSVVLERLVKYNGETHVELTAGEYTQLTGRAGRRGIDVEGHAVVLWNTGFDPEQVAGLASTRTYPLRSSFKPSYNMAVNLVASMGRDAARTLLESSFAQFQADRGVVGLARQVHRHDEAIAGYEEAMVCERGSVAEYAGLRRQLKRRETDLSRERGNQQRAQAGDSLRQLRVGDVIRIPAGRRQGLAIVLSEGSAVPASGRLTVLTADRQVKQLSVGDFASPVEALTRVRVGRSFNPRSPQSRRDLATSLRDIHIDDDDSRRRRPDSDSPAVTAGALDDEITRLRRELREHPVHDCPEREQHMRWAERADRLRRESFGLKQRVEGRTNTIARTFDRVCRLLEENGYLAPEGAAAADHELDAVEPEQGWSDPVTPAGKLLARIYSESDLLVAECLREGVWEGLTPPGLAAVASTLVYESRTDEYREPAIPGGQEVREALSETAELRERLKETESAFKLDQIPGMDAGFAWAAYQYASGAQLEKVLAGPEARSRAHGPTDAKPAAAMAAGDFVRWTRQLVDLLAQLSDVANEPLRSTARKAVAGLRRGVVAVDAQAG
jgi:ATP-dependent RNA helicase HelY